MSVIDSIKSKLLKDESAGTRRFRCEDCHNEFETAKNKDRRISCPVCVSNDVTEIEAA